MPYNAIVADQSGKRINTEELIDRAHALLLGLTSTDQLRIKVDTDANGDFTLPLLVNPNVLQRLLDTNSSFNPKATSSDYEDFYLYLVLQGIFKNPNDFLMGGSSVIVRELDTFMTYFDPDHKIMEFPY